MKSNLTRKFTSYFAITSIILTIIFASATGLAIKYSFNEYKIQNQTIRNKEIVSLIQDYYSESNGFSMELLRILMLKAMNSNYYITLYDSSETIIWSMDRNSHENHMMKNMNSNKDPKNYISEKYELYSNKLLVGTVEIGQYNSILLTTEDEVFIRNLGIGIITSGLFGLIISLIIGSVLSKKLAFPIINIKNTADKIKTGDFSARTPEEYNITELSDLSSSINQLGKFLDEQDNLRSRLTNDISHELRTPLYILKSHIEALIDGIWAPTPERLNILLDEIDRLSDLVKELENLKTLEVLEKLNLSTTNISEILRKVIIQYSPVFSEKKLIIAQNISENIFSKIDEYKMKQVFINLISNSIKFTNESDTIEFYLYKEENFIKIKFVDTGIGISKEDLNFIFERFYRTDSSRNRELGGSGLGLSIVKKIIALHGGQISVVSEINKGTEFIISLPINL